MEVNILGNKILMKNDSMINGLFTPQIPYDWLDKLPISAGGYTFKLACYLFHLKGIKGSSDNLTVSLKEINQISPENPIPEWAFPKAIDELVNAGMITAVRRRGKSPVITIICKEYYGNKHILKVQ